jgi:dephospho-CoA kinase
MVVAGLTGGIATGKSTVSKMLANMGAHIIDADRIAFEAVAKGRPAWRKIVDTFGEDILYPDGEIDRKKLGEIIFNSSQKKLMLNSIVHPEVFSETARMIKELSENPSSIIILDVPLLIESGMNKGIEDVMLVYTPESIQLARLMQRDGIDKEAAMAKIRSQMPIDEKLKYATIIIDNSSSLNSTAIHAQKAFDTLKERLSQL